MVKPGKVLITGSRGQLGHDLMRMLSVDYSVAGIYSDDVDIRDRSQFKECVQALRPDVIIHAAAYTDVDGAESSPDLAMSINGEGTRAVAEVCRESSIRLIYFSTDYVFDGRKGTAYLESDQPSPINVYGQSKLEGEKAISELLDDYVIIRIAWLYGKHGRNFVKSMLAIGDDWLRSSQEERRPLKVVDDQHGCPTWTEDVVRQTNHLLKHDAIGLFHAGSLGETTWYQFAREIFDLAGMDVELIPCTTADFPRPARRPAFSVLANRQLDKLGLNLMRDHRIALREFMVSLREGRNECLH